MAKITAEAPIAKWAAHNFSTSIEPVLFFSISVKLMNMKRL